MESGQYENCAGAVDAHRSVERVGARQDLAAAYGIKWRMGDKTTCNQDQRRCSNHAPTEAPEAGGERPKARDCQTTEPA